MRMWTLSIVFFGLLLSDVNGLGFCPFGWIPNGGLCLRTIVKQSFPEAVQECKNLNGRLFEPRSEKLSDLLLDMLKESGEYFAWLGIKNSKYVSDGKPIVFKKRAYFSDVGIIDKYGFWSSTRNDSFPFFSVCELPSTNTECATVATIFVEDSFPAVDNNACMAACASATDCRFWTYGGGKCGLRFFGAGGLVGGGIPGQSSTGFSTTVIATGGRVLVGKAVKNVSTAKKCQDLCSKDSKCKSFTWTNVDERFGGFNNQTCVFNYGETKRKIPLPGKSAFNIVSGPPSCSQDCSPI